MGDSVEQDRAVGSDPVRPEIMPSAVSSISFDTQRPAVTGNVFDSSGYKVEAKSRETEAEEASRLRREEREATFKLYKEGALTLVGILLVLGIAASCIKIVLDPTYPEKLRDSAMAIILLVVGGFIGYLTGKATKEK